jgi:hypothetical protein
MLDTTDHSCHGYKTVIFFTIYDANEKACLLVPLKPKWPSITFASKASW